MGHQQSKLVSIENISESDILIAIAGASGVGKSTFINSAARKEILPSRRLHEKALEIEYVQCSVVTKEYHQYRIILAELANIGSEHDAVSHLKVKNWLAGLSSKRIRVSGVVYLHRITDQGSSCMEAIERMGVLFETAKLALPDQIVLVTTMWNDLVTTKSVAESRQQELQKVCEKFLWAGSGTAPRVVRSGARFPDNAMEILSELVVHLELRQPQEDTWGKSEDAWKQIVKSREGRVRRDIEERRIRRELEESVREARERCTMERKKREMMEREARMGLEQEVIKAIELGAREREERQALERELIGQKARIELLEQEVREAKERESKEREARELLLHEVKEVERREAREREVLLRQVREANEREAQAYSAKEILEQEVNEVLKRITERDAITEDLENQLREAQESKSVGWGLRRWW